MRLAHKVCPRGIVIPVSSIPSLKKTSDDVLLLSSVRNCFAR